MNAKHIKTILAKHEFNVLGNHSTYGRRRQSWGGQENQDLWNNYLVWAADMTPPSKRHGSAFRPLLVVGIAEDDHNWYGNISAQHLFHKKFPVHIVKNWLPEPDLRQLADHGPLGLLKMKMQPQEKILVKPSRF